MFETIIDKVTSRVLCPNCKRREFTIFRRDNKRSGVYLCHCKCIRCNQLFHFYEGKEGKPMSPIELMEEKMNLSEEIREVVCKQLGVKPEEVMLESSIINDLGTDSLDAVELVMALEEKFGIEISDEEAEKMQTVDDIINYIEGKIKISSND